MSSLPATEQSVSNYHQDCKHEKDS